MLPPQNWYPDPADGTRLRWWDGQAWTQNTVPNPATPGFVPTRRRVWPWAVGGILVFLALVGIGLAIVVPRAVRTFTAPIDAANVYMRDVRDGNYAAAYKQACALRYSGMTLDQFAKLRQSQDAQDGRFLRFNAHGVHRVNSNEALVDIDLTTTQGRYPIQADMVRENGHWRWCTYRLVSK